MQEETNWEEPVGTCNGAPQRLNGLLCPGLPGLWVHLACYSLLCGPPTPTHPPTRAHECGPAQAPGPTQQPTPPCTSGYATCMAPTLNTRTSNHAHAEHHVTIPFVIPPCW